MADPGLSKACIYNSYARGWLHQGTQGSRLRAAAPFDLAQGVVSSPNHESALPLARLRPCVDGRAGLRLEPALAFALAFELAFESELEWELEFARASGRPQTPDPT